MASYGGWTRAAQNGWALEYASEDLKADREVASKLLCAELG
jgi:hypothetical protein